MIFVIFFLIIMDNYDPILINNPQIILINDINIIFYSSPEYGPWEGGTNITIRGVNLGKSFEDIARGVTVAGMACDPYQVRFFVLLVIFFSVDQCKMYHICWNIFLQWQLLIDSLSPFLNLLVTGNFVNLYPVPPTLPSPLRINYISLLFL